MVFNSQYDSCSRLKLCWWQFSGVGDKKIMTVSRQWIGHQYLKVVTNTFRLQHLSPTSMKPSSLEPISGRVLIWKPAFVNWSCRSFWIKISSNLSSSPSLFPGHYLNLTSLIMTHQLLPTNYNYLTNYFVCN